MKKVKISHYEFLELTFSSVMILSPRPRRPSPLRSPRPPPSPTSFSGPDWLSLTF